MEPMKQHITPVPSILRLPFAGVWLIKPECDCATLKGRFEEAATFEPIRVYAWLDTLLVGVAIAALIVGAVSALIAALC